MIRTVRSGKVVERSQFFCGPRRPRKDRRKGASSLVKMDQNMNQAVRRFARIINCNFGQDDLFLTLTYDRKPETWQEADHRVELFMRRMETAGVKLRGVWITADKDKKGDPERLHHHLIVKGGQIDLRQEGEALVAYTGAKRIADVWGQGFVHAEKLRANEDYTPLAAYLVRQAVNEPDAKKWHASRGLAKPVIEEEKIVDRARELKAPSGAEVLEVGHYDQESGSHYIRYIRRPSKKQQETLHIGFDWAAGPYAARYLGDAAGGGED